MSTDKNDNQTKIYFMAYELLQADPEKAQLLYENEHFWKFRPIVTFDLMSIELVKETSPFMFSLLKKFTTMLYNLKLLENFPQIIKLVRFLNQTLNKSIFKSEAKNKSIKDFIDSNTLPKGLTRNHIQQGIDCLQNVWSYSKNLLNDHSKKILNLLSRNRVLFYNSKFFN